MAISNTFNHPLTDGSDHHLLSTSKRVTILSYGIASYLIGFSGLLAIIFAMAGFIPLGLFTISSNPLVSIVINVLLTFLFGLQHSVMARPWFKERMHNWLDPACERSTFIWSSGVVSIIMIACWQPVGDVVWQTHSLAANIVMWFLFFSGWAYLVAATFAINHWDLFGLRQAWCAFSGKPYTNPEFKENWMYRFSRHPIMLGVLIGIWFVPTMTASKLVLSICFTCYIFIGVAYEEKDLIKEFGERYLEYKKRVGMFFTF